MKGEADMQNESTQVVVSYDGTVIEGTLCVPDAPTTQLALLVHGIMSSRDELGLFSGLASHLAHNGIASFRFDYRCHGKNSQAMEAMTLAGIVNDIEAAYLFANGRLRPKRTHAIGMSFGGGLTAYWAATTHKKIQSVVMLAPVIDYQEDVLGQHGLMDGTRIGNEASRALVNNGHVETDGFRYGPALINELPYINGIVGLTRLKCKSLILHGDADSIVPYSSSVKFSKLNQLCEIVNIPETDHGFGVPGDEDLTSPETKMRHVEVFDVITSFILSEE